MTLFAPAFDRVATDAHNFAEALAELADCFEARGALLVGGQGSHSARTYNVFHALSSHRGVCTARVVQVGATPVRGYEFAESKAVRKGRFLGLVCDEDNQPELSEARCERWVRQLEAEGLFECPLRTSVV